MISQEISGNHNKDRQEVKDLRAEVRRLKERTHRYQDHVKAIKEKHRERLKQAEESYRAQMVQQLSEYKKILEDYRVKIDKANAEREAQVSFVWIYHIGKDF